MLGVFAEFETNLRRERQAEGIKAAKGRGVYRGRPPKINMTEIQNRLGEGQTPTQIARDMGISRGTIYKVKDRINSGKKTTEEPST
jgi:DNA invertase Pin-like site-specific DNA recombinase